jgi:hypothetical protein
MLGTKRDCEEALSKIPLIIVRMEKWESGSLAAEDISIGKVVSLNLVTGTAKSYFCLSDFVAVELIMVIRCKGVEAALTSGVAVLGRRLREPS